MTILVPLIRTGAQALISYLLVLAASHGLDLNLSSEAEGALVVALTALVAGGLHLVERRFPKLAARLAAPIYTLKQLVDRFNLDVRVGGHSLFPEEAEAEEADYDRPEDAGRATDLP